VDHSDPDGKNIFQNKDFVNEVSTIKGIIIGENIQKSDKSTFTEKEKETILRNEGGNWKKDLRTTNKAAEAWRRDDGAFAVFYSVDDSKSWVVASLIWTGAFRTH
jgi:hypothetical protein